jgi:hypothetical protein
VPRSIDESHSTSSSEQNQKSMYVVPPQMHGKYSITSGRQVGELPYWIYPCVLVFMVLLSSTPRNPTVPTGAGPQSSGPRPANTPSITSASSPHIPTGSPSTDPLDIRIQRKGASIAGAAVQNLSIHLSTHTATMPSSKSSACSGDPALTMSWGPRSPASSNIRVQRHLDDVRSFLKSAPIRRLDEPFTEETAYPRGEAQAVKECASPLPNIISFSPAWKDNAWPPNMDMDSSSTIADEGATQGFNDIFTFGQDTSTGDLDLQKSCDLFEPGVPNFFAPLPRGQDRKCSMDLSDSSLSPIIGRDLTMTFSDSGFCDRSPETAGHCMSFQESPFMGHDSPETMFEMWPSLGKSVDTGPGICPFLLILRFLCRETDDGSEPHRPRATARRLRRPNSLPTELRPFPHDAQ